MASNMSYSEEGEDDQEENGETSIAAVPSAGLAAPCSTPVRQPSMSFIHKLMIQGSYSYIKSVYSRQYYAHCTLIYTAL